MIDIYSYFRLQMMSNKAIGPSLLDLTIRASTSLEKLSWAMSAKAIGSMAGVLLLGRSLIST